MWTWRLTLQSPPAAWYLGCWYWQGANHLLRVEQQVWPFWPYSDRCCQCHVWLLWPDMLWLLPRPSAVRVAAAVRPGYRRPASSHSGAAEAARWWPAGTSCPVHRSEDKCQNRSWLLVPGAHKHFLLHVTNILWHRHYLHITGLYSEPWVLWACQRNQKCYEFQNSEIVLVTPRRKQFNGL